MNVQIAETITLLEKDFRKMNGNAVVALNVG